MKERLDMTPLKAIRKYCLWCSTNQPKEIKFCPILECALYGYRFGKNPRRKNIGGNPQFRNGSKMALCARNDQLN